ncbi:MAG: hypothetical protein US83_C0010G0015 [Candidatus Falkowbacteria bacterium GW2011_GWC2_38_22]|uniref:UPF0102 protein US91_C0006G0093 n=1 Tax=Candidatus Falkowbacteria bacterium GW2011_GWE1_38_31 TaxID=1618638 RepID=A0A0G0M9B3_9BACT|nr:MAG: hypothetical protein US73_C0005G0015 [Candidatus Falkowbacteria bacterium GW2011_GWF2_38_1205]KKQ60981.1 MAG: hypothetical protein US83_C0010G0015 [Candidatus Falkowbacteria bacterium GW2011_GWC2_38_22]KKQ63490.1 MAG: hypothetical protein US84_C0006G0093 [Candidatus Falkowbacteria bacterium GW2011_GWF1_38_22]KKQ65439.1 MAG: hypothetical protein US87_C0007G0015 [Candidatus Falkowbacteria bacterium GW2011_GWE2_38_254]KKQ70254.1 MAG: hypothetical protein US91_C0006G0093 [Candidatus Falkowb
MYKNKIIGDYGEDLACNYLCRHGYVVIERNYRFSHLEIDIIANFKEKIVFIEVKTRTSDRYGTADEAVNSKKTGNLNRAVCCYLSKNNIFHENIRLDLIAVDIDKIKKVAYIKHYKDIV